MNNNTENTLKRWLKRKVKVTLGMMVAFMITGTVGYALDSEESLIIDTEATKEYNEDLNLNIKGEAIDKPFIVPGQKKFLTGIEIYPKPQEEVKFNGKNINVTVSDIGAEGNGNAYGVFAPNGKITLGNENTEKINIIVKSENNSANGISMLSTKPNSNYPSETLTEAVDSLTINGKELNIDVEGAKYSSGIYLVGNTRELIVNSENTTINVKSGTNNGIGIAANSNSKIEVNGNLEINADTVLEMTGDNSKVTINEGNNRTVKLDGNINLENKGTLNLNLSDSNSYLNGNIYNEQGIANIGLSNGAQWTTNENSFVNTLNFNDGIININGGNDHTVKIEKIEGTGGTVNIKTSVTDNGFDAGKLVIGKETESEEKAVAFLVEEVSTPKLDVNFTGITADYITTKEFGELAQGHITGDGLGNLDTTVKVEEGLTEGAITGNLGTDGVTNVTQNTTTTTMDGLQALATNTYIAWKQEMNSLNKRMGELRNSTGNEGVWARVYAGESEYNKGYENKYQTYQVGYDKKYSTDNGTGFVGYLVSYTQGDTDYSHNSYGTGDNTSVGGGIYGTWLGNSGDYVDVIFKVSRLENKYDVTSLSGINSKGDYNTFGMSLSAEYGRRFNVTKGFFIEPSVEMSLGRVGAEDYRTSSGVNVEQDTIYTAEGRVGTALGYNFDKGNVYVRVAGVKEFAGEIDTTIGGKLMTEDLGDSWVEYGIGANYRVLENLNLYVDFEKTGSAEVQTNWQGNLGFRYEF